MKKKVIEQAASDFAGDRNEGAGHGFPSFTANLIAKGFVKGAEYAQKRMYTEEDMLEAAKYGYDYHATTSFPDKSFEDNCARNTQQWMTKFKKQK